MPMMRATKGFRYATRDLVAGDEFEVNPHHVRILVALKKVEDMPAPEPARRAAAPKAAGPAPETTAQEPAPDPTPAESEVPEPTRAELMELAESRGVELPRGYVSKERLVELLGETDDGAAEMQIFGLSITRTKALSMVPDSSRGWMSLIREPFAGAWQRNIEIRTENVLTHPIVYACVTLIASDIAKIRLRLVQKDENGIWTETENASYSPVLRKPNRYQTRIKFIENWVTSKLIHGNTYVLKSKDNRGVVNAMYILDPTRVKPLVADDGSVFYELHNDNLTGVAATVVVPASEIIHDTMVALYHPLVGVSAITACGLAAVHGLNIQKDQTTFFANGGRPSGILISPTAITDERAKAIQAQWDETYGRGGLGRTAILGGGMTYLPLTMSAVDKQLIDQLKWTAETVCSCFHVPPYMVGVGPAPTYNNIEALNQQYYAQCLQSLIEAIELLLDEGLALIKPFGTEFDLDDLLRMDTATRVKAASDAIGSGGMAPNEARKRYFDLGPVKGGESPYLQEQNFSLAALAERDRDKPFSKPVASVPSTPSAPPGAAEEEMEDADGGDDEQRDIAADLYHRAAKFDDRKAA